MGKLVTYLFIAIGMTMLIFASLLVTIRSRTRVSDWLAAYVLCLGYIWAYFGLYRSTAFAWAPWLIYSDIFVEFFAGPALVLYTKGLIGERPRRRILYPLTLGLGGAFLAFLILGRPGPGLPSPARLGANPDYFSSRAIASFNAIADLYFFGCVSASTASVARLYRAGQPAFRKAFRGVLAYYLVGFLTIVGFALGHALRSDAALGMAVLANGLNTTYLFFLSFRYPERTQRVLRTRNPALRFQKLSTAEGMASKELRRLRSLVEEEGLYRDPGLSLQALSIRLGIQNHQLSQLLKEGLGMSFRAYIKQSRLAEAKSLLVEEPELSILDIAFSVGFNSKSAFNAAFAKEEGSAPSEFRKKALGKS